MKNKNKRFALIGPIIMLYYPTPCADDTLNHNCDPCEEDEHGRVRSVFFIHKSFTFVDATNPTEWTDGINAGLIIVIPKTNGSFDGGTPKEGPGYGDAVSAYIGSDFSLKFNDPNYVSNCTFYNRLKQSRNWKPGYCTENFAHISNKPGVVLPKNPVQDDLTSKVVWDVEVKWFDKDIACPTAIPEGIFDQCVLTA